MGSAAGQPQPPGASPYQPIWENPVSQPVPRFEILLSRHSAHRTKSLARSRKPRFLLAYDVPCTMLGLRKPFYDTTKIAKVDGKYCIYIRDDEIIYYVTLRFPRDLVAMLVSGCKGRRQRSPDQSNATKF